LQYDFPAVLSHLDREVEAAVSEGLTLEKDDPSYVLK
jgi:hypothetical protein